MKTTAISLGVFIALLLGFYGGYAYAGTKTTSNASAGASPSPHGFPGGGNGGFNGGGGFVARCSTGTSGRPAPVSGTITSVTSTSFVVHNGLCNTDTTVSFGSAANFFNVGKGSASDLVANATVIVSGTRNPDGSIQALTITIVPAGVNLQGIFGGRGGAGAGAGTATTGGGSGG